MCDSADPALFTFAVAQSFDRHIHKPWRNCFINQDSFTFSFDKNRFRGRKRENPTKKLNACLALFEYKDFLSTTFLFFFLSHGKQRGLLLQLALVLPVHFPLHSLLYILRTPGLLQLWRHGKGSTTRPYLPPPERARSLSSRCFLWHWWRRWYTKWNQKP